MVERRISALLAGLAVLLVCAMLWDAFGRVRARRPAPRALSAVDTASASHRPGPLSETTAVQGARVPAPVPPAPAAPGAPRTVVAPSHVPYAELLAPFETRRRIPASAGRTYPNEVVAATGSTMLPGWE